MSLVPAQLPAEFSRDALPKKVMERQEQEKEAELPSAASREQVLN